MDWYFYSGSGSFFMFRYFVVITILVLGSFLSYSVLADVYSKEQLVTQNRDAVAGGKGTLYGQFAFKRDAALKNQAIKEIGWMTLQPGDSIGLHRHETTEDSYIIISGTGTFTDTDGKHYIVKAGDVTIARKGQIHALANTSNEPLVFIDVIAEQ